MIFVHKNQPILNQILDFLIRNLNRFRWNNNSNFRLDYTVIDSQNLSILTEPDNLKTLINTSNFNPILVNA